MKRPVMDWPAGPDPASRTTLGKAAGAFAPGVEPERKLLRLGDASLTQAANAHAKCHPIHQAEAPTVHERKRRDLRRACIHESAHSIVAWEFGIPGNVTVYRTRDGGERNVYFRGQFHYFGVGTLQEMRLIALAGIVAEEIDDYCDVQSWEVWEGLQLQTVELSPTDALLAGAYSEQDVDDCLQLVRKLWPGLVLAAKYQSGEYADVEDMCWET